jgi:hypothetical protein
MLAQLTTFLRGLFRCFLGMFHGKSWGPVTGKAMTREEYEVLLAELPRIHRGDPSWGPGAVPVLYEDRGDLFATPPRCPFIELQGTFQNWDGTYSQESIAMGHSLIVRGDAAAYSAAEHLPDICHAISVTPAGRCAG